MKGWKLAMLAVVLFALGFATGAGWNQQPAELVAESVPVPQVTNVEPVAENPHADLPPEFAEHLAQRNWPALVELLEAARFADDDSDYLPMYTRMLNVAAEFGEQDAPAAGADLLTNFIELNPHDEAALFLLADLRRQDEDYPAALDATFAILDYPLTAEVAQQAAALRDGLIASYVESLAEAPLTEHADFYRDLVAREPTNDQHRLRLAETLIALDESAEASEVLAAVGGFGVAADQVSELKQQLQLAEAGVPIERVGNALYALVEINGEQLRLLVDTGATKTVIESASLDLVAGTRLNRNARLLTAGGPVDAELFTVSRLQFGSLALDDFEVVALPTIPDGPLSEGPTDGLLGMDLLTQVDGLNLP